VQGYFSPLEHFDNTFLTYTVLLHDWLNQPGYGSLFTLSLLASSLIPLGSEWLLVMMLAKGYPPVATVLTATAGNFIGALSTYAIGIYGGRWLIEKVLRISTEQQQRATGYYRKYGSISLFFSWLPVVGDPLCLVGGMLKTPLWLFTVLVLSGKLLRYAAVAWITLG
jgi:membrane protein YqaA with SNARE-associated domain